MSKAEKFISYCTKTCSNLMQVPTLDDKGNIVSEAHPWLTPDQAREAVEIAREEMIEKAIKWVEYNNENGGCKFDGWAEDIKQAMKEDISECIRQI